MTRFYTLIARSLSLGVIEPLNITDFSYLFARHLMPLYIDLPKVSDS